MQPRIATAEYIRDLAAALAKIAEGNGLKALSLFLSMAALEAGDQLRREPRKPIGKHLH